MALVINCPSCPRQLRVPDDLLGQQVKCPSCGVVFAASGDATSVVAAPPESQAPEVEPSSGADDGEKVTRQRDEAPPRSSRVRRLSDSRAKDDDYDEDDDRDRPRSGGYRRGRGAALGRVSGPATALIVTGCIALGLSVFSLCVNIFVLANARGPDDDRPARMVGGLFGAFLGLGWGGFVVFGAKKMKNLENYGLAMAGAIMAMMPCNCCCLLGLPFGIWALVVLSDAQVKAAFD